MADPPTRVPSDPAQPRPRRPQRPTMDESGSESTLPDWQAIKNTQKKQSSRHRAKPATPPLAADAAPAPAQPISIVFTDDAPMSTPPPSTPTAAPAVTEPKSAPAASEAGEATAQAVIDVEAFTRNFARLVEEGGRALAAYIKPREEGTQKIGYSDEVADALKTLGQVLNYWYADPQRTVEMQTRLGKSYLELFASASRRLAGEPSAPVVKPDANDKRFKDPEWSSNQFFDFLKQAYLLTADWARYLVQDADKLDPRVRQKAEFYMRQIINAVSPSNFVLTNPELLRTTLSENAENLVRGAHMLAEDIEAGGGELRIRQSDMSKFEVGRNLAISPGKVIYQNELMQLIQYQASTETVRKRPLLIVPPWINKFYVLDLTPEKSFIKWCVDQGLTVFVVSWVNPDARLAKKSFADYMHQGPLEAIDAVTKITGENEIDVMGYCVGGTLLATTLAYMAAKGDHRVASATFLAAQVDFTYSGDLKVFAATEEQVAAVERQMAERGYLEGAKMATVFNLLRSNDLIWPYVVSNYLKGEAPFPFDLLYWNADATRMPAANHSFYMRNCYLDNTLAKRKMEFDGVKIDLSKITIPVYNLAAREDHIAPAKSVYAGSSLFGGPMRYVLAGSGHIAGVVNPPVKMKYQYWTGDAPKGHDVDAWIRNATEHKGSWWIDWIAWMRERDGEMVPAREIGGGKLAPIEDAPGSYVKVKS